MQFLFLVFSALIGTISIVLVISKKQYYKYFTPLAIAIVTGTESEHLCDVINKHAIGRCLSHDLSLSL